MKKLYNAPEVELLRFAPVEQIASGEGVDADTLSLTNPSKEISNPNNAIFIPGSYMGF